MLEESARLFVERALRECGGNRNATARKLGLARSALFKRLKRWGLSAEDEAQQQPALPAA